MLNEIFDINTFNIYSDEENNALVILKNYDDEDSYYDVLFTYIISLKEKNAKLINNLDNSNN